MDAKLIQIPNQKKNCSYYVATILVATGFRQKVTETFFYLDYGIPNKKVYTLSLGTIGVVDLATNVKKPFVRV